MSARGRFDHDESHGSVRNEITGTVHGNVVQTRTVSGGVHVHWPTGAASWLVGTAVVCAVAAFGVISAAVGAQRWPSVAMSVLAALVLVFWLMRRRARATEQVGAAVRTLRDEVRRQWTQEVGTRGLRQPRPLRLKWRRTARPVSVPDDSGDTPVDGERSSGRALGEAFRTNHRRQLVLLGAPGSGKSTLATLGALAVIEDSREEDPVPVLLSVAGWDPSEPVEDWIARRIAADYPVLAPQSHLPELVRRLLADRRILPVLDGLDEMPRPLLAMALADLDRSAGAGLRMLITCRSAEFEEAVSGGGPLSQAVVVEIEPVATDDVVTYLQEREVTGADRWSPVVEALRADPRGPLARALSTPLMISLARQVYRKPSSDPGQLAAFSTSEEIENHLLEQFLPTAYPKEPERARRWLAFLAHHLEIRVAGPNFEWWHLPRAVPRWILGLLSGLSTAVAVVVPHLLATIGSDAMYTAETLGVGVHLGVMLGVGVGVRVARTAHVAGRRSRNRVWTVLRGAAGDLLAAVAVLALILAVLVLAEGVSAWVSGHEPSLLVMQPGWRGPVAFHVTGAVLFFAVANVLGLDRSGTPQRNVPRVTTLIPRLVICALAGLLFVPVVYVVFLLFGKELGEREVGLVAVFCVVLAGIPVGVARGLAAPIPHRSAVSPLDVLRSDRATVLVTAVACGVASALVFSASAGGSPSQSGFWLRAITVSVIAVVVSASLGPAWMSYSFARIWLAVRGRLPLRLMAFLQDTHAAGVLRQVGPAYQIRHELLRKHFARQAERR
ncbi:NACHT domain-containing protein [Saccharopolyspora antimicrobica]|uniref:NACHT domain-containing protein n=1 Tax=Saccharopolyspora antimicrobica TaxID=455193 RepID=A0A1I4R343_9PSEU|nr:NACHT domain-containing protein [Saccharopolyspora antimicrobica]RKT88199.1 NACHT domain-containing protein [Saccharopolyspora antimicrobica]SFM46376.1 NACHT domain-containing protein [Saccharopolyspora antimicrobica]